MTNVLTLKFDRDSQDFFEGMRRKHFPPERNVIGAHLTLFHTLPDEPSIAEFVHAIAEYQEPFPVQVTGLRSLGKGVAYTLRSAKLMEIFDDLAHEFRTELSAQDKQKFAPHVVVQNKVTPEKARVLLAELQAAFTPFTVWATGFELWHYLGGPWQLAQEILFQAKDIHDEEGGTASDLGWAAIQASGGEPVD